MANTYVGFWHELIKNLNKLLGIRIIIKYLYFYKNMHLLVSLEAWSWQHVYFIFDIEIESVNKQQYQVIIARVGSQDHKSYLKNLEIK